MSEAKRKSGRYPWSKKTPEPVRLSDGKYVAFARGNDKPRTSSITVFGFDIYSPEGFEKSISSFTKPIVSADKFTVSYISCADTDNSCLTISTDEDETPVINVTGQEAEDIYNTFVNQVMRAR